MVRQTKSLRVKGIREEVKEDAAESIQWKPDSGELKTIYSNHIQILAGPWDITVRLGQLDFTTDDITAKELVRVFMSPQHAKALAGLLVRQLKLHEERFGAAAAILSEAAEEDFVQS